MIPTLLGIVMAVVGVLGLLAIIVAAVIKDGEHTRVGWHRTQENIWCADDGQSFVVREDDGNWYAYLDDGSDRRRGPFGSAKQAMAYAG